MALFTVKNTAPITLHSLVEQQEEKYLSLEKVIPSKDTAAIYLSVYFCLLIYSDWELSTKSSALE